MSRMSNCLCGLEDMDSGFRTDIFCPVHDGGEPYVSTPSPDQPEDAALREALGKFSGQGAHACHCPRSTDGGCTCALKDEYVDEILQLFHAHESKAVQAAKKQGFYMGCGVGGIEAYAVEDLWNKCIEVLEQADAGRSGEQTNV